MRGFQSRFCVYNVRNDSIKKNVFKPKDENQDSCVDINTDNFSQQVSY